MSIRANQMRPSIADEALLNEREAKIRQMEIEQLYRYAPIGLCILTRDFRFVRINERLAQINGLAAEEHIGRTIWEVLPDIADTLAKVFHSIFQTGQPVLDLEIQGTSPRTPGIERDALASFIPYRSETGEIIGIIGAVIEITERKRMERMLHKREAQLSAFFNCAPAGMLMADRDFRFIQVNETLAAINGSSVEEHAGKPIRELLPGIFALFEPLWRRILETGETVLNLEVKGETPRDPGVTRDWIVSFFPIQEDDGNITSIGGVVVETTEMKEAERKLRESEARFRSLAESIDEVFWLTDWPEGKVVYVSPAFERVWGIPAEELYRKPMLWAEPISDPAQRHLVEKAFHEIEKTDGYNVIYRIRRPDQTERWISDRGFLIRNEKHEVIRIAGVAHDVTERKRNEDILKTQAENLRAYADEIRDLYNNAPCGYHSLDADGFIVQINETELSWLRYRREEIIGRLRFPDLLTEESRLIFEQNFPIFKKQGFVRDLKFEMRRKDGSTFPVILSGSAIYDPSGNFIMSRSTMFDYTAQKRLEDELQAALLARDEFLSIASHDLKNPLTSLKLQIQLIENTLQGVRIPETAVQLLSQAKRQVDRVNHLVEDLLDLTRIREGKLTLEVSDTDLRSSVSKIVADYATEAASRGVTIRVHGDPAVIGKWDPHRIDQVLSNLISNAIKYGNGAPVDIWIHQDPNREIAILRVVDLGLGIPHGLQDKIFERFERASEGGKIEGLGLGLYITRQIIEAHHGKIRVISAPGQGSTFTVELPLSSTEPG